MSRADDLIADFHREAERTQRVLEACPGERFGERDDDRAMTLGQLVGHVAENPRWVESMAEPEMDLAARGEAYEPFVPSTTQEALEAFESNAIAFERTVVDWSDEFLAETWTMRAGDRVLVSAPRGRIVRDIGIHHMIHHRGQLTARLRALGLAVPPTYGPTADFPDAVGA